MIRVVIAASSDVARAGLASLAAGLAGIDVAGQATDGDGLALVLRSTDPDIVWIDDSAGGEERLSQFLGAVADGPHGPGLVVLSDHPPDVPLGGGRRAEAYALLPRGASADEIDAA